LHGFSDASEEAYGAVVYMRSTYPSGQVHTALIMAKTKVAPVKRQTIPRLELCGALILSRILKRVQGILKIPDSNVYAWTDSTIVLDWLQGNPRRFKTFVGNRVSEIIDSILPSHWRHVPTNSNPADCASRGMSPTELESYQLWWEGPGWLKLEPSEWPAQRKTQDEEPKEELRILTAIVEMRKPVVPFNRFSDYNKLVRVVAWILRFSNNIKSRNRATTGTYLTSSELDNAEKHLLLAAQSESFQSEIAAVQSEESVSKSSNLKHLFPFLDADGLLRAKGRIQNSQVTYQQKHPLILKGNHAVTKLLIWMEHIRLLHGGPTQVFASLCGK
jgi:hypothetical protein